MIEPDLDNQAEKPPPAPAIVRRVALARGPMAGVALLLAVPLAAAFGVFGASERTAAATFAGLEVSIVHPARTRYMTTRALDVAVRNVGGEATAAVAVGIDRAYVDAFSDARFVPDVRRIGDEGYEIELGSLAPATTRRVHAWLQADAYGRHAGMVSISAGGRVLGRIPIETLTLP